MDTLNENKQDYPDTINPLPPPKHRSRDYPTKLGLFLGEIKWAVLSRGGYQFYVPNETSLVEWIYKEYKRRGQNYKAVEIFHTIQEAWLSQPFGKCYECQQLFARILITIFPSEYGYDIQPLKKFCSQCGRVKDIGDFAYSYTSRSKKKKVCKTCDYIQKSSMSQLSPEAKAELSPEQQREAALHELCNPRPSAESLESLDNDADFSSDRLEQLGELEQ